MASEGSVYCQCDTDSYSNLPQGAHVFPNVLRLFTAFHSSMTLTSTLCYSFNITINLSCVICDLKCQSVLQKRLGVCRTEGTGDSLLQVLAVNTTGP